MLRQYQSGIHDLSNQQCSISHSDQSSGRIPNWTERRAGRLGESRRCSGRSPPGRTLSGIYLRKPNLWYDPTAFALPVAGTYGDVGRNVLIVPGLRSFDLSLFKSTRLTERWNLQFRAEVFNLFNHPNFGVPSPIVLTTSGAPAAAAGLLSATSTSSRQIQFGVKLSF